ncbi:MAG: hypothetical protein BWY76_02402 [bacterium ADurb.Bin429]|nr:MAG: hypothetical protein BWY76_02402 [bacterium ADurb.Bin429]
MSRWYGVGALLVLLCSLLLAGCGKFHPRTQAEKNICAVVAQQGNGLMEVIAIKQLASEVDADGITTDRYDVTVQATQTRDNGRTQQQQMLFYVNPDNQEVLDVQ